MAIANPRTPGPAARLVFLASLLSVSAAAADFPQWRGPSRDGVITGLAPRATWPDSLKPAWKVTVGVGHSSPVVVGDRVFQFSRIDDSEVVQALALASGKSVWRQSYPAPYT